jgi:hypothetical protein
VQILGRTISVDHVAKYKPRELKEGEEPEGTANYQL